MSNQQLNDHEIINPALPIAPYLGGKSRLAKKIIQIIDSTPHKRYAEPFIGMGGVFLRRTRKPKSEAINDFNGEVANLFRILQRHYVQFLETLKFQLTTRSEFERLKKTDPSTLTDLERAARFLYLQRTTFGGKVTGQTYGISPDRGASFDLNKLTPMLEEAHERLSGVWIENLNYDVFIQKYDHADTLFYLDPPYFNNENDYGKDMFAKADFERLAAQLATIKGKFILSLNDTPEVREIFESFEIMGVSVKYSVNPAAQSDRGEVIISNYNI